MTDLLAGVARFIVRLLLLAAGVIFVASLLLAFFVVFLAWALRAIWASLTGKPIAPIRMRVDPRAGFGRVYRAADGAWARRGASAPAAAQPTRKLDDVTDVEARPVPPAPPRDRLDG